MHVILTFSTTGIMALTGSVIASDVYAWTAVFILPVNSAINPMLYTVTSFLNKRVINYYLFHDLLSAMVVSRESRLVVAVLEFRLHVLSTLVIIPLLSNSSQLEFIINKRCSRILYSNNYSDFNTLNKHNRAYLM